MKSIEEKAVEELFLSTIKSYNLYDLKEAVRNDISLLKETVKYVPGYLSIAEKIAGHFKLYSNLFTLNNFLIYLKERKPGFYRYFNRNRKGRKWLDKQINQFKYYLFS